MDNVRPLLSKHRKDAYYVIVLHVLKLVIQLSAFVVISRYANISDVGSFVIAILFLGLLELFRDFGLRVTSTQSTDLSKEKSSNLFWVSTFLGFVFFLTTFLATILFINLQIWTESFQYLRILSVTLFLSGVSSQLHTKLFRDQKFNTFGLIDFTSQSVGAFIGIALAITGSGADSFVWQYLTSAVFTLLLRNHFAKLKVYKPTNMIETLNEIRFARNLGAVQILNWLGNNFDTFVLSLRFDSAAVAIYTRAFGLILTTQQNMVEAIGNWVLPMIKHGSQSGVPIQIKFLKVAFLLSVIFVPLNIFFISIHEPIIEFILGPKWMGIGLYSVIFAITMIFSQAAAYGRWILISADQTSTLLKQTVVTRTILIIGVIAASNFSPLYIAYAILFSNFFSAVLSLYQCRNISTIWNSALSRFTVTVFLSSSLFIVLILCLKNFLINALQWSMGFGLSVILCLIIYRSYRVAIKKLESKDFNLIQTISDLL